MKEKKIDQKKIEQKKIEQMRDTIERHRIGCVIMASGLSRRFGSDKLMAEVEGKTFLQRILEKTEGTLFAQRVAVTRSREAELLCTEQGIPVIRHDLPGRNDTVRLGTEFLMQSVPELDGILFCPCDQPFLSRNSIERMCLWDKLSEDTILRMAYGEICGAPVLFGSAYFEELCHLPEKKGGSHLIRQYPQKVRYISAEHAYELYDIDTPEDLQSALVQFAGDYISWEIESRH